VVVALIVFPPTRILMSEIRSVELLWRLNTPEGDTPPSFTKISSCPPPAANTVEMATFGTLGDPPLFPQTVVEEPEVVPILMPFANTKIDCSLTLFTGASKLRPGGTQLVVWLVVCCRVQAMVNGPFPLG
jgi:hypothetical protein